MNVLLHIDNQTIQDELSQGFQENGLVVLASSDTADLAEMFRNRTPHLLILDWDKCREQASHCLHRLRELYPFLPVYVIFLSEQIHHQKVLDAHRAGADMLLPYGVDRDMLLQQAVRSAHLVEQERKKITHPIVHICSYCNRVRDQHHEWIDRASRRPPENDLVVSHGICPDCFNRMHGGAAEAGFEQTIAG